MWFTTVRGETVCLDIGPLQKGTGEPREVWKVDMRKVLGVFPSLAPMGYGKTCSIAGTGISFMSRPATGRTELMKCPLPRPQAWSAFTKPPAK